MEQNLNSDSNSPPGRSNKYIVHDVRPLRCIVPVFSNASQTSSGHFPPGVRPWYPFLVSAAGGGADNGPGNSGFGSAIPAPLNSPRTPLGNGEASLARRASKTRVSASVVMEGTGQQLSGLSLQNSNADDAGSSVKRRGRQRKVKGGSGADIDVESLANSFLTLFKLEESDDFKRSSGDKETAGTILMVFDLIRRKLFQLEEARDKNPGARRPDLKTGSVLMEKGVRTNQAKRIGNVPGVDVGDIFFFRMELCLVGLHAPSMAGIDYMGLKITMGEEPVAVSIVSSGGYDDDDGDGADSNVLIYSGQGGVARKDGQMFDQKLERGNLALEKSLHRGNDVRVIRGFKDPFVTAGKFYVYDGLYKIQRSWSEANKSGCTVFKYKLLRQPGQPEAFSLWKSIQQWKTSSATRPSLINPDLSSGAETQPVALVNEVDGENGPPHFSYVPTLKYSQPFPASNPFPGCHCLAGCQPGNTSCSCSHRNDGLLPYSSLGTLLLLTSESVIHECGHTCSCPSSCRNRTTQAGTKLRLEVFKTWTKGWGLRSWDPIRAGTFICEYAGDIIEATTAGEFENDNYIFDTGRHYHYAGDIIKAPFPLVISSKRNGNVSRFMNHSCSPNVLWQPVIRGSSDGVFLHVGFFAQRHIPPMQELTYDYGMPAEIDQGKKRCLCGSVNCRGYFY